MLSPLSKRRLATCHADLIRVIELAAEDSAFIVVWGARGRADQEQAYRTGMSQLQWPDSKHNVTPERPKSLAVDLAPVKPDGSIDWSDLGAFERLADVVRDAAAKAGVEIVWGGDWKMRDYGHFELNARE